MNIKRLESWFLSNQRKLNFRQSRDPYHVWVSEIMLQQTQAETVEPYFKTFIETYPTIEALANASDDKLKLSVQGIGYYRRFKYMKEAAIKILNHHKGVFPKTYEEIISLPGIGTYTAGAMMSIAYNEPYSALDGNVIRVLSRMLGDSHDMRQDVNKKRLDLYNQSMIEKANPRIYSEAMIELGALICRPKQPKCEICPLNEHCYAFLNDQVENYPFLSKLKKQKVLSYIVFVLEDEHHYYLNKRKESLLEGMYEWPQFEKESLYSALDELSDLNINAYVKEDLGFYKHVFSHQIWEMQVYKLFVTNDKSDIYLKIKKSELKHYPMAIAHQKIKIA